MKRLYYDDAYTVAFNAQVIEKFTVDGQPAVILDRTYFYPTGGGQPHDTGSLNGIPVIDVGTRADDAAVIHILTAPLEDDDVSAEIDWPRRFHHMQHHTGQHILTQAFVETANAHTIGFHLGSETITIDLDTLDLTPEHLHQAEALANRIVADNRTVAATLIDPSDAGDVRMRKMPDQITTDGLRVVEVTDFDRTACGGTHVAHTGEIGLIKILKTEKRGETTRVEFRCGGAALADYGHKHALLDRLSTMLTCGIDDLPDIITKMQDDLQQANKALRLAQDMLITYEAEHLLQQTPETQGRRIVVHHLTEGGDARALASQLVEHERTIALIAASDGSTQLVAARSADLDVNMRPVFEAATAQLDGVRGGGRPDFVQGGGASHPPEAIQAALDAARNALS